MLLRPVALLALLAACATPPADDPVEPAAPQELTLTASDFAFTGPDTIAPGLTRVSLVNTGSEPHHVIIGRLGAGKTLADLQAFMAENPNAEPDFLTWLGGGGMILPGSTSAATSDLPAGDYVLFCFIPSPDGIPHLAKGMIRPLTVSGTPVVADAPTHDATIELNEFGFVVPDLTAGTHTLRIENTGAQTHEIALVRLDEGATMESYLAGVQPGATTPPPGQPIGGNGAISPGLANFMTVDLAPGRYLLLCWVPDPADGVPHVMKGMVTEVVIS